MCYTYFCKIKEVVIKNYKVLLFFLVWGVSCSSDSSSEDTVNPVTQSSDSSVNPSVESLVENTQSSFNVSFDSEKWHSLNFSSIPANEVDFSSQKISIKVNQSASPLIYSMVDQPLSVKKLSIKGSVSGLVNIQSPGQQGQENFDDFNLRLGLVLLGDNTLRWYQRAVAANWVKELFKLAPEGQGIEHIYFLNAVLDPSLQYQKRTHPLSEYIREDYVWVMNQTGPFSYSYEFESPKEIGALWISVDGDDTNSQFDIEIESISIN